MLVDLHPRRLRRQLSTLLNMMMVLAGAFMAYKTLGVIANTGTPAVVVLSGSMEPAFQRGDILLLWNRENHVNVGDVVVYETNRRSIPIVHRVVHDHESSRKQLVLTKGDNNPTNDLDLYGYRQNYLDRTKDIEGGVVKFYIPKLGYATIVMTENPKIKTVFLALAVLFAGLTE